MANKKGSKRIANRKKSITILESSGRGSLKTKLQKRETTLKELSDEDKALFMSLDELNDKELDKLKDFLDSLDHEPIFIAADGATCD